MKKIIALFILSFFANLSFSQVGINTTNPEAQLDIKSSNQLTPSYKDGVLIPKIDAFPIVNPTAAQNSMMVYLTTVSSGKQPGFYFWDNATTSWKGFGGNSGWELTGNTGTNPSVNFIGTTDDVDLVFRRENVESGKITDSSVFLGMNAGSLTTSLIGDSVGIGFNALKTGTGPGLGNSYGNFNVAIGYDAIGNNIDGGGNVAVGGSSLVGNTRGSENTGVGNRSLEANKTGDSNTSLGSNALNTNVAGSNATAIGVSAMQYANNTITPFNNTNLAVGFESLRGSFSPASNTGNNNTAIGYQTLLNNTTGSNNIAIGYQSLNTKSTGSLNIAIGYQAGFNETGSNKLYIENSNSTTPLIYGEFNNDLLKVNGRLKIDNTATFGNEMQVKNSNMYVHGVDANLNFTSASATSDDFMVSSEESEFETGGIRGDGNNVTIWSPGDDNRQLRIVDEDAWSDNNGIPYENGAEMAYIAANGQYFQVSDKNKKENILKIESSLDKIQKISGYTYQYKLLSEEIKKGQKPVSASGVLAQELEKVLPEAVQKNEYGEYFVDYAGITPLLIEAIKEQNTKIKALESSNSEILKRLEILENK